MTNTSHTHTKSSITDLEVISTTATDNHIVKRTTGGNITVPTTPNDSGSATSKTYVDAEVSKKANASHTHTIADITDLTVSTGTTSGHVVQRTTSGNITVPTTPHSSSSATSKSYVDAQVGGKADTSHSHVKANITDLETISTGATGNHIVKRNTDGNITVPSTPPTLTSAASKYYVDARVNSKANTSHTHTVEQVTGLQSALDNSLPWAGTRTQYNAIATKDANRLYIIMGA